MTTRRIEKYRNKRKGIAKTEYRIFEMLNDVSEKLDYVIERVDKTSESLYELAKQPTEMFGVSKEAFDDKFRESLKEYEKWIGGTE